MNFTASEIWKQSNKIRFDVDKVVNLNNVDFLIKDDEIECLQFFNIDFNDNLLNLMKSTIVNDKIIKFKYIDMTSVEQIKLNQLCKNKKLMIEINDEWKAPILELNEPLSNYIANCSDQLKRDYAKYKQDKNITYKIFNNADLELWTDVLKIDKESWKGENLCDMKSLKREDLQYIFYLLNSNENASLIVSYYNDIPVAYSLWFKAEKNSTWYAAKWGASNYGRTINAGIKTLFYHIEHILDKQSSLLLDFWGRRSRFYDMLKNKDVDRFHFTVRGKNDK